MRTEVRNIKCVHKVMYFPLCDLVLNSLDSGSAPVSLSVSPKRSQFFKYDSFSVSCEGEEQSEEEVAGWRVMKRTEDGEVRPCPSSCSITAAFPATDSGVYWCETGRGETSNSVNISVTADFYKDGVFIRSSSTGNMTIHSVSPSDEGLYRCNVSGAGGSADSWLTVRAPPAGRDPPPPLLSVSALLRHLVAGAPYLLSTILLGLIYRDRARGEELTSLQELFIFKCRRKKYSSQPWLQPLSATSLLQTISTTAVSDQHIPPRLQAAAAPATPQQQLYTPSAPAPPKASARPCLTEIREMTTTS
ncbi:uncharacterized protein LOC144459633 isoform X2 [Epinephelus lanceolatus]